MVTQKTSLGMLDGTPLKRMFWSIISDYGLKTGICELIDNAIDLWTEGGRKRKLNIEIELDPIRQLITVKDDAGGVRQSELSLLIAPGGSRNDPSARLIGIFGVGGKRAGIALGEQVEIRTRFEKEQAFELDISRDWLNTDDWEMPLYAIEDFPPGTTIVEISRLREQLDDAQVAEMCTHLGETYSTFLKNGCRMKLNGEPVPALDFDHWAYPKTFEPQQAKFAVDFDSERIEVEITAGLISDRDPQKENYGVYFFCNDRLIVKELRTRDVGYFVSTEAGVPHPDASMCRAIVRINGPARHMPWNSSKSGINIAHQAFLEIRPVLIQLVSYFSSLSRRLKHEWSESVTPYATGEIKEVEQADIEARKRLHLPELPRVKKRKVEHLKIANAKTLKNYPWTLGLVEAIAAVDIIKRQRIDTKNRIALILLDSNFEIGLKEFIVHRHDLFPPKQYPDSRIASLFQSRAMVIQEVMNKIKIPAKVIGIANHYFSVRNKLIHERATIQVTDTDIDLYRSAVQTILQILFRLKFPE